MGEILPGSLLVKFGFSFWNKGSFFPTGYTRPFLLVRFLGGPPMAPARFGEIIRVYDRDQMRNYLPSGARIVDPPRNSDSYELRLPIKTFEDFWYIYGYVGGIKRLAGSENTTTSFLCQVVVKIVWVDDSVPYSEHRCAFARVQAYSADFADDFCGNEFIVSMRDFVQGFITAPFSDKHSGANLNFWRFANMTE